MSQAFYCHTSPSFQRIPCAWKQGIWLKAPNSLQLIPHLKSSFSAVKCQIEGIRSGMSHKRVVKFCFDEPSFLKKRKDEAKSWHIKLISEPRLSCGAPEGADR